MGKAVAQRHRSRTITNASETFTKPTCTRSSRVSASPRRNYSGGRRRRGTTREELYTQPAMPGRRTFLDETP